MLQDLTCGLPKARFLLLSGITCLLILNQSKWLFTTATITSSRANTNMFHSYLRAFLPILLRANSSMFVLTWDECFLYFINARTFCDPFLFKLIPQIERFRPSRVLQKNLESSSIFLIIHITRGVSRQASHQLLPATTASCNVSYDHGEGLTAR